MPTDADAIVPIGQALHLPLLFGRCSTKGNAFRDSTNFFPYPIISLSVNDHFL